ncbi:MAG: radical SAM protein [Clostridiales bacterium]|nr:radical SAM protein [Clostridiales bacterium]
MNLQERVDLKKADRNDLYTLEPPFPRTNFLIETSNACNHDCIFCAHRKMKRKVGIIKPELVENVLWQAYNLGTREVGFYATGEPFLVKQLPDYIRLAKSIGYEYVYLTSNGALATPERIREVIAAGLDSIKFSINAPERKVYEFIHGHDDFDKVFEHLKYLYRYRNESGSKYRILVTGILTRFTENMREKWFDVFGDCCDEIVFKMVYNQGGYMPEIETLLKCESDKEQYRRCNLPFDAICVTCEGYLSVENADYENMLVVADLNKVSLKDGWYSENMKKVRQAFIDDKMDGLICDGCVHHCAKPSEPIMPELSEANPEIYSDRLVRERMKEFGFMDNKIVYLPMTVDIVHPGHINIIKIAARYGKVMVGLFTDEAIMEYKKPPVMSYVQRKIIIENIKGVDIVVPQVSRNYGPNLTKYKPSYMIHGTDWREGPLAEVRAAAIALMATWGGEVIEPDYTQGISSSALKKKMQTGE